MNELHGTSPSLSPASCPSPLVPSRGGAPSQTASHSHYGESLEPGPHRGRSRRWGDASAAVQREIVDQILTEASRQGLAAEDSAFAVAVARVESGFNPDAAAGSTSASGVGQLIDRTAKALGVKDRFDPAENISGMITLLKDGLTRAAKAGLRGDDRYARTYGLYHDGPSLSYGGEQIAREKVVPWVSKVGEWLRCR